MLAEEFGLINNGTDNKQVILNDSGYVMVYRNAFKKLAKEAPSLSVMKVFSLLTSMQGHPNGISMTKQAIADTIGTTYKSVWSACKWLEEHHYIRNRKINGQMQFFLNPDVTICERKHQVKNLHRQATK